MPADNGTLSDKNSRIEEEEFDEGKENDEEEKVIKIWDCGSPLYDSYELVALSHLIDRHLMALPYLSGSRKETYESFQKAKSRIEEVTTSKNKLIKGSLMVRFHNGSMEKIKEKDIADGERRKKMKWGIVKICSRIISWKKIK